MRSRACAEVPAPDILPRLWELAQRRLAEVGPSVGAPIAYEAGEPTSKGFRLAASYSRSQNRIRIFRAPANMPADPTQPDASRPLGDSISVAHEVGHVGEDGTGSVLDQEAAAYDVARRLLESVGFGAWPQFEADREDCLQAYKSGARVPTIVEPMKDPEKKAVKALGRRRVTRVTRRPPRS
jgi:hypothetical protein